MARKTYNEKLNDSKDMPKVVEITDPRTIQIYGGRRMLIAPPLDYDRIMRQVPAGKVITSDQVREVLARRIGADLTCWMTAGIFINICAQASEERGIDPIPYWRTLKKGGELNPKYPGGIQRQQDNLEREGHVIEKRGSRFFVKYYSDKIHLPD